MAQCDWRILWKTAPTHRAAALLSTGCSKHTSRNPAARDQQRRRRFLRPFQGCNLVGLQHPDRMLAKEEEKLRRFLKLLCVIDGIVQGRT